MKAQVGLIKEFGVYVEGWGLGLSLRTSGFKSKQTREFGALSCTYTDLNISMQYPASLHAIDGRGTGSTAWLGRFSSHHREALHASGSGP